MSKRTTSRLDPPRAVVLTVGGDTRVWEQFVASLAGWVVEPAPRDAHGQWGNYAAPPLAILAHLADDEPEQITRAGLERVTDIRKHWPDTPVALYVSVHDVGARKLLRARCWNVAAVLFAGSDDLPGDAENAIARTRAVHLAQRVWRTIEGCGSESAAAELARATATAVDHLSVTQFAEPTGVGPRALNRRYAALGLPSIRRVQDLGRCLCAVDLAATRVWSLAAACRALRLAQARTLRLTFRRQFGAPPVALVKTGGVEGMLASVRERLTRGGGATARRRSVRRSAAP